MHSPLLLQLVVILVVARLCGLLLRRFGQPPVIGEMAAGIVLGPIVFGAAFPEAHAPLFPQASLGALTSLSTLGLVLFMFVVGAELRAPDGVRAQVRAAGWVGAAAACCCRWRWAWRSRRGCIRRWRRPASASGRSRCSWPRRCRSPPSR